MKNEYAKILHVLDERNRLMQELGEQGIAVRHTRLHGTQISALTRNGREWEPFSIERARELLGERAGPFRLDIANASGELRTE